MFVWCKSTTYYYNKRIQFVTYLYDFVQSPLFNN